MNRVYITGSLLRRLKRDRDVLNEIICIMDNATHTHAPADVIVRNIKAVLQRRRER